MHRFDHWRFHILIGAIVFLGGGVFFRLFTLQILGYDYWNKMAQGQQQIYQDLFPERGEIMMQDLSVRARTDERRYIPLAINREFFQVYLVPKNLTGDQDELAGKLAVLLEMDKELVLSRMNRPDDPYEPLRHKVERELADQIEALGVAGVEVAPETWRYYPNGTLACHVLGFVGLGQESRIGQYGLEGYYEDELKGKPGFFSGQKDTGGYWIPSLKQEMRPAQDGARLILTIDQNIQFQAEKELKEVIEKYQAEAGSVMILEPATGAVLALANWPVFDPNNYGQVESIDLFLNSAIQKVYEPGSVFKPLTMAIGIDSGQINAQTVYDDEGYVSVGGRTIWNSLRKGYGDQTMTNVLEKSLNTGAVFAQQAVGGEKFKSYVERFNLNKPTGIDLWGEIFGDTANLYTGREINLATIAFGQGITVTPLGMLAAISSLANGGQIMRPFVVEKIIWPDGVEKVTVPQPVGQVVSAQTAEEVAKMMTSVTENGSGRFARVEGYALAVKTGTAEMVDPATGNYSEEVIHTYVGFAPALDPKFSILIKMEKPKGVRFAEGSLGPAVKNLAEYLFNYLEIPPQY